jgi:hypothetical protein
MSTIDNKELIDTIIAQNGYFEDDPRVYQIVEYRNAYGNIAWGVTWINETMDRRERYLKETYYVRRPKLIWKSV